MPRPRADRSRRASRSDWGPRSDWSNRSDWSDRRNRVRWLNRGRRLYRSYRRRRPRLCRRILSCHRPVELPCQRQHRPGLHLHRSHHHTIHFPQQLDGHIHSQYTGSVCSGPCPLDLQPAHRHLGHLELHSQRHRHRHHRHQHRLFRKVQHREIRGPWRHLYHPAPQHHFQRNHTV